MKELTNPLLSTQELLNQDLEFAQTQNVGELEYAMLLRIAPGLLQKYAKNRALEGLPVEIAPIIIEYFTRKSQKGLVIDERETLQLAVLCQYVMRSEEHASLSLDRLLGLLGNYRLSELYFTPVNDQDFYTSNKRLLQDTLTDVSKLYGYLKSQASIRISLLDEIGNKSKAPEFSAPTGPMLHGKILADNFIIEDTLSTIKSLVVQWNADLMHMMRKPQNLHGRYKKELIAFILEYPFVQSLSDEQQAYLLATVSAYITPVYKELLQEAYLARVVRFLRNKPLSCTEGLLNEIQKHLDESMKQELAKWVARDLAANEKLYPAKIREVLYDRNLLLRDQKHLNAQAHKFLATQVMQFFDLENDQSSLFSAEVLNLVWHNSTYCVDANLMRILACTDFATKKLDPEIVVKLRDMIMRLLTLSDSLNTEQALRIDARRIMRLDRTTIMNFILEATDANYSWWSGSTPARFKLEGIGFNKQIINTAFICVMYRTIDDKYVVFNPEKVYSELSFDNSARGKWLLAKYIERLCAPAAGGPLRALRFTQYSRYVPRHTATIARTAERAQTPANLQSTHFVQEHALVRSPSMPTLAHDGSQSLPTFSGRPCLNEGETFDHLSSRDSSRRPSEANGDDVYTFEPYSAMEEELSLQKPSQGSEVKIIQVPLKELGVGPTQQRKLLDEFDEMWRRTKPSWDWEPISDGPNTNDIFGVPSRRQSVSSDVQYQTSESAELTKLSPLQFSTLPLKSPPALDYLDPSKGSAKPNGASLDQKPRVEPRW